MNKEQWKLLYKEIPATTNVLLGNDLNYSFPQLPLSLIFDENTSLFEGCVYTRQLLLTRQALKQTKGNGTPVSMFHTLFRNTKVNDEMLTSMVRLLLKLRKEEK